MGFLFDTSLPVFLLVTVVLAGGGGYLSGKAIAQTWRSPWQTIPAAAVLGAAARFMHFALFGGTLVSLPHLAVDMLVVLALALLGYRRGRAIQMVGQYAFLYRPAGPFGWRRRPGTPA